MDWLTSPDIWIALLTLTVLEIVLGIDNVVFIAILASKLPPHQQSRARVMGLTLALITRIMLLLSLAWMIRLTTPLFHVLGQGISGRDLILIGGGLFLLARSTQEIHNTVESDEAEDRRGTQAGVSFAGVIVQILFLDMVFSLDSVITAVGMVEQVGIMIAAIVIGVGVMLIASNAVSLFVNRHPTVKMLALGFLLLIGTALVAEGFEMHVPKGYIYFAMGFAVFVELLNLRMGRAPRQVHSPGGFQTPPKVVPVTNVSVRPEMRTPTSSTATSRTVAGHVLSKSRSVEVIQHALWDTTSSEDLHHPGTQ